jgi:hypothetical protein
MKNRDPTHWRDAWQLEHVTGKYVISDKPMTEEQWIKERAVVVDGDDAVDATPQPERCPLCCPWTTAKRRNDSGTMVFVILAR